MKAFAENHAPGLFEMVDSALQGDYAQSDKREDLRQQRVVAELHRYAYFCNQVQFCVLCIQIYINECLI